MKKVVILITNALLIAFVGITIQAQSKVAYNDLHRPQIHFSPKANWMNDPNGLVYHKGAYHMFFQYYPDSTVWGPMHWGHAISNDLVHWSEQPIALYPDSLGYIFSGSAVVDHNNTSGFGKEDNAPLVAIFTYHNPVLSQQNKDAQYQGLAYSLDDGHTWTKYENNPVLNNPGITDFRDPKVMWYPPENKWIMTLATKDQVTFYSSPNLKEWKKESEFGEKLGAHGGVWECPDLIPFETDGKKIWVLFVSINPGGLNGGSATQYFVGDFDGKTFTSYSNETKWIDYGTDNYAGVTWSNTDDRKIFLGWMSNWQYANKVPTKAWRSAMTIPRELKLKKVDNNYLVSSMPVKELDKLKKDVVSLKNIKINGQYDLSQKVKGLSGQYRIHLTADQAESFSIVLSNELSEELIVGYSKEEKEYFIDRTKSGKIDFENGFARRYAGRRLSKNNKLDITLIVDAASVELFADDGLTVMTGIFFPNKAYNKAIIKSPNSFIINELVYAEMKSIWQNQSASSQQKQLGIFEGHGDIGAGVKPGSAKYDSKTRQYELSGAGNNIWGNHDEFHFMWKRMKGDFILYTRG
ncbi:MAG: glycoside hydrolase family 32 protein, partial [Chitinophagaceae bacterium]|nr:glycoside hydrolase family 32 protein [Chitinophagaceae bacterium]